MPLDVSDRYEENETVSPLHAPETGILVSDLLPCLATPEE